MMRREDDRFLDDDFLMDEEDFTLADSLTSRRSHRLTSLRMSALEARRAVEDIMLMRQYYDIHNEVYDC